VGFGFADPADAPRFGWVAELNPLDPAAFPVKRTALGRFARAGIAATQTPDGRPVIFMTQDDPSGFLFRFIGASPGNLDSGTLSVAQISYSDIKWIDLGNDIPTLAGALSAAAAAGASPFDAPGGIAIAPGNSTLYLACAGTRRATRTAPTRSTRAPGMITGISSFSRPPKATRPLTASPATWPSPPATPPPPNSPNTPRARRAGSASPGR
jgi:secreted PhoX family phosphatase